MTRLLFVATRFPYPPHSGERLRVFNLLAELSNSYSVTLLCFGDANDFEVDSLVRLASLNSVVVVKPKIIERISGLVKSLLVGRALQIGFFSSPTLRNWLEKNQSEYDIGIFHLLRGAQYANSFHGSLRVLEMCDANSEIYRQNVRVTRWFQPWHWISRYESYYALKAERDACRSFDLVTFHTSHDASIVTDDLSNIFISTQGVDLSAYPFRPVSGRSLNELIFIGKMDFRPNLDAVEWFIESVMPRLPADVRLKIIGVCPRAIAGRLKRKSDRVSITGRVPSISESALTGGIGIAPMRTAAGIQNKVLEYFALGMPVVATETVLKGLHASAAECVQVASTVDQWVASIERLRLDKALSSRLSESGRRYVEREHSWSRIGGEYLAELQKRLGTKRKHQRASCES